MDIYDELGIRPFINAYRPLTRLGGAALPEPVSEAMRQAARKNIHLSIMQRKVGEAIARLTNNEAAYVSCGASSGITLAVAACMAGTDPILSDRLPNTEGIKNQVIMHACERGYKSDVAIRCAGATIVNVGNDAGANEFELSSAITDQTAAILAHDQPHPGKLRLEQMVTIARERQVPVLIDAAFSVPPRRRLWEYTRDGGADAVFISGGKGLRGPQCSGLVLGQAWLVNACAFHGTPNMRIGQGMKVGKEELAGIYAAVKLFMEQDEASEQATPAQQLDWIIASIGNLPYVRCRKVNRTKATITFDTKVYPFTCQAARCWLLDSTPSVYVESSSEGLIVGTECMEEGHERVVANQLKRLFGQRTDIQGL
jgi:uncharacterized pyridoxal phosphate-dependent enzyme